MSSHDYGKIESVLIRADTYRIAYLRMSKIALVLAGLTLISTLSAIYLIVDRPAPIYFATNADGSITPIVPLREPHLSPAEIANFATEAATRALTYSFSNYRGEFEDLKPYFTKPRGWNSFVDALNRSGQLDLVKNQRLNTTAVAQRAVIAREGINVDGAYEWIVQLPIRVTYQSSSQVTGQSFMITLSLVRQPTNEYPRAVAVSYFNAAPGA